MIRKRALVSFNSSRPQSYCFLKALPGSADMDNERNALYASILRSFCRWIGSGLGSTRRHPGGLLTS